MDIRQALLGFKLYAVTDLAEVSDLFFDSTEKLLKGGVDVLQLRSKVLPDADLFKAGLRLRELTRKYDVLFAVNDRPDLAVLLDADILHLGQDDLGVAHLRDFFKRCDKDILIGKSTHSIEQAIKAEAERVDYIGVGPVYATPTKKDYVPVGLDLVKQVKDRIKLPFVCIGGINCENCDEVLAAGAKRIALVRALFNAPDPYGTVKKLKEKLNNNG